MLNLSKFASNVLSSIDNAAKESREEPKQLSAAQIRSERKQRSKVEDESEYPSAAGNEGEQTGDESLRSSTDPVSSDSPEVVGASLSTISNVSKTESDFGTVGNEGNMISPALDNEGNLIIGDFGTSKPYTAPASRNKSITATRKQADNSENEDLKDKDKEIEKLNEECLELEDQVQALKNEVKEAWGSYKTSQERAAVREAELQDELRQLARAKGSDKQSLLLQMGKVGEEVDSALKKMRAMQAERDSLSAQLLTAMEGTAQWEKKEAALEVQLVEARTGSVQGVQGLREEMREIIGRSEKMREEHALLLRQSQVRQAELEQSNVELSIGITERQREITRLKIQQEQDGREDVNTSIREVDGLRQQMAALSEELETERQRLQEQEKRIRQSDCESRAASMSWVDERQRLTSSLQSLEAQVVALEEAREKDKANQRPARGLFLKNLDDESSNSSGSVVMIMSEEEEERNNWNAQIQNLSKQLLKKQGDVLDLQAERVALKSRVQDLLARCSRTEQQLQAIQEADGNGDDDDEDVEKGQYNYNDYRVDRSSTSSLSGLQQRRSGGGGGPQNRKVLADLEQMGVRTPATVARAVNLIDSWTFMTGKFLRRYPLIRLGFIMYLLLLHVWVFVILSLHVHSFELDTTPQQALSLV